MKRAALALLVSTASVTVLHIHKRPAPVSSAALAPVLDMPHVSRNHLRLPLRPVNTAQSRQGTSPSRRHTARRVARPAGAAALNWHGLALCESTDDPRAVDPTGTYFGLYQFDILTWRSVGGRGNPAEASPAEQTLRARILYGQRGRAPWPVCGVHL